MDTKSYDTYWLEKGNELVNNTISSLNTHLNNYMLYLNGLTGFYLVAGTTVGVIYIPEDICAYLLYIVPLAFVQLAKFNITVNPKINITTLDLRSPLKISDAHNHLILELQKQLKKAKTWIGIATFAVLVGGSLSFRLINIEKKENKKEAATQKTEDDIYKKNNTLLKYKVTQSIINGKQKKLTIEAKFSEDQTLKIIYFKTKKDTIKPQIKFLKVPKYQDFKYEISNFYKIIEVSKN